MKWVALLALALAPDSREEKGKLKLTCLGKEAGVEEYRLESFEDGHTVLFSKARFEVEIQGRKRACLVDTALTLDKDFGPHLYAGYHKVDGRERITRVEWKKGAAVVDRRREVRTSARFVVDDQVVAHLIPILRRHGGGRATVQVFRPAAAADAEAVVEDRGEVSLRAGGRSVRAREFRVVLGPVVTIAHLDGQKRLLRAECASLGTLAELEGFEGMEPEAAIEESEVRFGESSGTLTRARGLAGVPAVVLLGDRDPGELPREVASTLARAGVSVLRCDGRGRGDISLSDRVADAQAAMAFLRSREDVGAVGLIGHGEGGVVASMVAAGDGGVRVLFLLAAPGRPLDELLLDRFERSQRAQGVREESLKSALGSQRRLFERIRNADDDWMEIDERRTFIGGMREQFNLDPAEVVAKVKGSVVLFHGTKDREIPPEDAGILAKARPGTEIERLDGLDHAFARPGGSAAPDGGFLKLLADRAARHLVENRGNGR